MSNKNSENQIQYMPIGMSIGVALGVAVGAFTHNMPICMCVGLSIGMAAGTFIDAKVRKNKEESDKKATEKEMLWAGRFVVLAISIIAVLIASNPNSGTIMGLVENAWGVFGAAFGPAILLSLFWRRFNFAGAVAGIVTGAAVDILWLVFLGNLGIYEIIPGFILSAIVGVVVSLLTKAPSDEVTALYDKVANGEID